MDNDSNLNKRKGIILAGGTGSRLSPLTMAVSKQLMPVYDKPMIYYPLSTLMLCGIREILIITTSQDVESFKRLLGDGNSLGISLSYAIQKKPEGLAQAFLIANKFINNSPVVLILGDNLFHGSEMIKILRDANKRLDRNTVIGYQVNNPQDYGVINFDENGKVLSIEEKPKKPKSNYVLTGIYFYAKDIVEKANKVKYSERRELEITDINLMYLSEGKLSVELLGRGSAWLDTGNFDSLHEASSYIKTIENRQGFKVSSPEEIAWRLKWINDNDLLSLSKKYLKSGYGQYLKGLLDSKII